MTTKNAPLAVICAMAAEKAALREHMSHIEVRELLGRPVTLGRLEDHDVVVAESGVGKVASAVTAALLAREFSCRGLVVSGVAGGLDPALNIGDTVIAQSLVQHDYGHLHDAALTPFRPGVPPLGDHRHDFSFDLPAALAEKLGRLAAEIALPDLPADLLPTQSAEAPPRRVLMGRILSGDQFINSEAVRDRLHRAFSAHAVEMEGAAVAQVGALLGLPVVVVRCLSDLAGADSHLDFPRFVSAVAPGAALVLRRIIRAL
ncbi:5'-methylthioadenosine/adenosylhomocysteine nucleosidase [Dongia rigui]|uniref:5'-methylthioadenosine/adenosylhomocysteine nucleosidase n=1 Tax=Dongia rigui TaxID=940149 RepID=A0ABU5E377_9PROT|nr:5'-methylthioadenosine/adenosylhomocysteine nucleosidase [Dongia rigui]MDY0874065.1 5'-methylthioadenosine/adenosylhomocysteine nucleosidase [Dongia rigui]